MCRTSEKPFECRPDDAIASDDVAVLHEVRAELLTSASTAPTAAPATS